MGLFENLRGKGKTGFMKRRISILFLIACLLISSLGLSACGASGEPAGAASQVQTAVPETAEESLTETAGLEAVTEETSAQDSQSEKSEGVTENEPADELKGAAENVPETAISESAGESSDFTLSVEEGGTYSDKDHVALYLHTYGHLPDNYIRKNDARDLGWDAGKGNLWDVAPGMSIGGDRFGNREGNLPDVDGRKYYECDINYEGGYRSGERIVYSNDGDVYYSEDHYANFELLYTAEGKAE